jgi:chromosome segregation ATPase
VDERAVTELRGLADLDAVLSAGAARLRGLDGEVAVLRARAEAIDAFFAAYPDEEARLAHEVREAETELARRRHELAEAERALAQAADDEAKIHAEHGAARAHDHVAVAESRVARAQAASARLERDAKALPRELDELEARARAVPDVPPLGRSLAEWAAHAHAALFVAKGQIDAQRDGVIREANELASMLLGEPTYGATVAQALTRVEGFTAVETHKQ